MDFNTTIDIILKDLREVREIVDDLRNYPGVPALQVELAKSKCRSAEEIIALLKTILPSEGEKKFAAEKTQKAEIKQEETPENEPEAYPAENLIIISDEDHEEGVKEEPVTPPAVKKSDPSIIADKFSGGPNIVMDQFGTTKKDDGIASVIKTQPVERLSDAIGVNDKFLFIREIFSGSRQVFDEAVSKLEKAGNFQDARAIIMSYSEKGEDNEVVMQLLDIVKRKLP